MQAFQDVSQRLQCGEQSWSPHHVKCFFASECGEHSHRAERRRNACRPQTLNCGGTPATSWARRTRLLFRKSGHEFQLRSTVLRAHLLQWRTEKRAYKDRAQHHTLTTSRLCKAALRVHQNRAFQTRRGPQCAPSTKSSGHQAVPRTSEVLLKKCQRHPSKSGTKGLFPKNWHHR